MSGDSKGFRIRLMHQVKSYVEDFKNESWIDNIPPDYGCYIEWVNAPDQISFCLYTEVEDNQELGQGTKGRSFSRANKAVFF